MRKRVFYTLCLILLFVCSAKAQTANEPLIVRALVIDGDTVPYVVLDEVRAFARHKFKNKRAEIRYTRLVRNVKKVLPYARMCAGEINIINEGLSELTTDKEKKAYLKVKEKELFEKFEQPLRHLTITQGRILIKLIDRETGNTSFELIRTLKGRFSAFIWQGVARLFGSNLKSEYDSEVKDAEIENIILLIDEGLI
ncbi:MAG: DUF4294 domain-containing protein [Bacteroidales bacterium]|nr:DUF4294 domain-containing protein [Bacteroidales bacterium]